MKYTFALTTPTYRQRAIAACQRAPEGFIAEFREPTRSDRQNSKMWALIKDMREQSEAMAEFTPDQAKLRFLNALDNEMQFLPELWGGGQFVVGQRSSTLSKSRFADLIELMLKWGAENEIRWSRESMDVAAEHNIELSEVNPMTEMEQSQ